MWCHNYNNLKTFSNSDKFIDIWLKILFLSINFLFKIIFLHNSFPFSIPFGVFLQNCKKKLIFIIQNLCNNQEILLEERKSIVFPTFFSFFKLYNQMQVLKLYANTCNSYALVYNI